MTCYRLVNETLYGMDGGPCGDATPDSPYVQCCAIGHMCLENNFCLSADGSEYYVAGCTDDNYGTSCSKTCSGYGQNATDITYNYTEKSWHCCSWGDGLWYERNCDIVIQNTSSSAPPPGLLATTAVVVNLSAWAAIAMPVTNSITNVYTSLSTDPPTTTSSELASTSMTTVTIAASTTTVTMTATPSPGPVRTPVGSWVGIGILIAVALLALAAAGYSFYRVHKLQTTLKRHQESMPLVNRDQLKYSPYNSPSSHEQSHVDQNYPSVGSYQDSYRERRIPELAGFSEASELGSQER